MYGRILYVVSSMASSLLVLFGTAYGNLTATQASSMLYVQVLGQVAGGFCWVQVTRRWGNTALMMISHAIPVTVALIGVGVHFAAPATGVSCAIPVGIMVFLSGMNISAWLGFAHRVIDTVDPAKRTGYLVLQSLAQFPFTFASYLAGMVAERFSYLPVFVAILLSSGAGLVLTGSPQRAQHRHPRRNLGRVRGKITVPALKSCMKSAILIPMFGEKGALFPCLI